MLSLMLIKPFPNGLNPRNHPPPTLSITQNPVMHAQQEPVRLSGDRQPRRAINPETPVLLTALRPVLRPEMPALTAPQQRRELLPVVPHDVIHGAESTARPQGLKVIGRLVQDGDGFCMSAAPGG